MYTLLFESVAFAQSGQGQQPSMWEFLILPVSFFVIFYLFLIRPQQKKQKDHDELLKNLKTGDEVVTSGGIIAKVKSVSDGFITIDPGANNLLKVKTGHIAALSTKPAVEKNAKTKKKS